MDCKTIVIDWLKSHDADGLCYPETECGCDINDLAVCGDGPYPQCQPAKRRILGDGEYIGDGVPGDFAYFAMQ